MLDASVLARSVQSHAEALAEKIEEEIQKEQKEFRLASSYWLSGSPMRAAATTSLNLHMQRLRR